MKKRYGIVALLAFSLGMASQSTIVFAATTDVPQVDSTVASVDNEAPAFTDPAEALQAAKLAEEAMLSNDDLKNALNEVQSAQEELGSAIQDGDQNALAAARSALDAAEEAYMRELSEISGVIESDIYSMRDSGMGWGQVGHELGVHPGMLGLGHNNSEPMHNEGVKPGTNHMGGIGEQELGEATARNMESGWARGHGEGIRSGDHDSSTGNMAMGTESSSNTRNRARTRSMWGEEGEQNNSGNDHQGGMGSSGGNDDNNSSGNMGSNESGSSGNMNGSHNGNDNQNSNDNHNGNDNQNSNDNHNGNDNQNNNDNHNGNDNQNDNDSHNGNDSGEMGGSGDHGGSWR